MRSDERTEKLALSLFDLDRVSDLLVKKILGGKVSKDVILHESEPIVQLTVGLETAALAIDVLRSECRREKQLAVRAYIYRQDQWSRLPADAVLTVECRGRYILNPAFFPIYESSLDSIPLSAEPLFGGDK